MKKKKHSVEPLTAYLNLSSLRIDGLPIDLQFKCIACLTIKDVKAHI